MARLGLIGLVLALSPAVAHADHPFILPSTTLLSGETAAVTFDAAASEAVFFFDHRPLAPETIKVFRPDDTLSDTARPQRTRFRSIVDMTLDQQGTWKVSSEQVMVTGTFTLNGEERRVGGRGGPPPATAMSGMGGQAGAGGAAGERGPGVGPGGPAGGPAGERRPPPVAVQDIPAAATDLHLTEIASRVQTFVTLGAPTTGVFKPTGAGLELEPITHPNALVAGETARFRFLIDGGPAAGVKVTVLPGGQRYRDNDRTMTLTTGADGTIALRWPGAGMYWLGAEAQDSHPAERRAEVRRLTYAATLEVMTP